MWKNRSAETDPLIVPTGTIPLVSNPKCLDAALLQTWPMRVRVNPPPTAPLTSPTPTSGRSKRTTPNLVSINLLQKTMITGNDVLQTAFAWEHTQLTSPILITTTRISKSTGRKRQGVPPSRPHSVTTIVKMITDRDGTMSQEQM